MPDRARAEPPADTPGAHRYARHDPLDPMWNDASDAASGLFGLPFGVEEASLVVVPVPWEASCSQGRGTAGAPARVLEASRYVELHDVALGNVYERGIAMAPAPDGLAPLIESARLASADPQAGTDALDSLCRQLNERVEASVADHLERGRRVGLLGGDHSVSFGAIAAHCRETPDLGILQIDAHADLRPSLDGLTWSHASVMHQVMERLRPERLTQVGIRALCGVERACLRSNERIATFTDHELQAALADGQTWSSLCERIVETLPANVYVTFDIDGLDPAYCPNTGTPVPGGPSYAQAVLLLHRVRESGRRICGFDLVEVGGQARDALIAAHLLYTLCGSVKARR